MGGVHAAVPRGRAAGAAAGMSGNEWLGLEGARAPVSPNHPSPPPLVALIPSPLLGPAVWRPVRTSLSDHGVDAVAISPAGSTPRTPEAVLNGLLAALPMDRDVALVPHSNAGLYVPELTRQRPVVGVVFVDAVLPPRQGAVPVAPPPLVELLEEKAAPDGLLPVWTEWWDGDEISGLFPCVDVRASVEREQTRLPLSYFTASVEVTAGWDEVPAAYLAFGETYREERTDAADRGWPVSTLPGRHLHMVVEPDCVAAEISRLLTALGLARSRD